MASKTQTQTQITDPQQFAVALLQQGRFPVTKSNVSFIEGWAQREGGNWSNTAAYNPLNTEQPLNGSVNYKTRAPGRGVQSYSSWNDGVTATLQTLNNGDYQPIVSALSSGDAMTANNQGQLGNALSTWSAGGYTMVGQASPTYTAQTGGAGKNPAVTIKTGVSSGLMGDCSTYRNSKAATSNCLVGGGGNILGLGAPCVIDACQAKALISGGIVLVGGALMLIGIALLFEGGRNAIGNAAQGGVNFLPGGAATQQGIQSATMSGSVAPRTGAQRHASGYKAPKPGRSIAADADDFSELAMA